MKYGIQLYSIRDIAMKDFEQAVEKVANMGYKMIEFAGFFGRTADEELLKKRSEDFYAGA